MMNHKKKSSGSLKKQQKKNKKTNRKGNRTKMSDSSSEEAVLAITQPDPDEVWPDVNFDAMPKLQKDKPQLQRSPTTVIETNNS